MTPAIQLAVIVAYILLGRWLVRWQGRARDAIFAILTIAVVFLLFFTKGSAWLYFPIYLALVSFQYLVLRWWGERPDGWSWLAFFTPVMILILVRYIPPELLAGFVPGIRHKLAVQPNWTWAVMFIGLSYLAFRTSSLALEVRNGLVKRPGFWDYLTFAFFVPTFSVGPITPYSIYRRGFSEAERPVIPAGQAFLRILVGAIKFSFLGPLLSQLTYSSFLLDGHRHHYIDMPIAILAFYLFLYCNFAGFCDMAIGISGLIGIPMTENFDNPFKARNVKDFWNRWHITLSLWMRDVVFSPLSKFLVRTFGPTRANHAIAITIMIVFILVGIWHGVGWHFAAYGAAHGLGVATNHYYTIMLKRRLGKEGFAAYNRNRLIRTIAVMMTFLFAATTLILFVNDFKGMKEIMMTFTGH